MIWTVLVISCFTLYMYALCRSVFYFLSLFGSRSFCDCFHLCLLCSQSCLVHFVSSANQLHSCPCFLSPVCCYLICSVCTSFPCLCQILRLLRESSMCSMFFLHMGPYGFVSLFITSLYSSSCLFNVY